MLKLARCIPLLALAVLPPALSGQAASGGADDASTRTLRFVQDDAQDYMVSKIYRLKYIQANDITPFVMGIVMRYNMNSTVNCVEYGADNAQMLTVTCPVEMMPYVDDFIAKADRNVLIDGKVPGDIVKGTGITRAVYRPKYRSGQALLNVLVDSQIGEGVYGSVYAWDRNSNQIYWKDNSSNTQYVYQFLGYLDRPAPQITLRKPCGGRRTIPRTDRASVLFFYSPTCAKCRLETHALPGVLAEVQFPMDFYAIDVDTDRRAFRAFRKALRTTNKNVRMVHLWDPDNESTLLLDYGVFSTPKVFVVWEGEILGRRLEMANLLEIIQYINMLYGQEKED